VAADSEYVHVYPDWHTFGGKQLIGVDAWFVHIDAKKYRNFCGLWLCDYMLSFVLLMTMSTNNKCT
jgi:hypothetical protein